MTNDQHLEQSIVGRSDLAAVLRGHEWPRREVSSAGEAFSLEAKSALVVWPSNSHQPCSVVINDGEQDEFFAWLSTYHNDLAPLTSWCHLFSKSEWRRFGQHFTVKPRLRGLEAAWIGAVIAEAMILSERSFDKLSLTSCLSTSSFSVARLYGLYEQEGVASLLSSKEQRSIFRSRDFESQKESTLLYIFELLVTLRSRDNVVLSEASTHIYEICHVMDVSAGYSDQSRETIDGRLRSLFKIIPGFANIKSFSQASAEDYVRLLRTLKEGFDKFDQQQSQAASFLSGFMISQLGGAERDLRLADQFGARRNDVLLWASVLGGLGVEIYWSAAFAGLGRLVARELVRPFRISDAPSGDISFSELRFLEKISQSGLADIRTANRNVVSVSLRAGVIANIFSSQLSSRNGDVSKIQSVSVEDNPTIDNLHLNEMRRLAGDLFPHLVPLIRNEFKQGYTKKPAGRSQNELKLK